jgi:hypothetical protein
LREYSVDEDVFEFVFGTGGLRGWKVFYCETWTVEETCWEVLLEIDEETGAFFAVEN